jgi:hypothetical protein
MWIRGLKEIDGESDSEDVVKMTPNLFFSREFLVLWSFQQSSYIFDAMI